MRNATRHGMGAIREVAEGGRGLLRGARALATALALVATAGGAQALQERGEALRYVRAGEGGATLRNIGDPKGLEVGEVPPETPLAVHEEKGSWLRVEVPGGYSAWIFGRYLGATGVADWYTVTGSPVLLRPLPDSSAKSYPVDRAYTGDRVRMIERADLSKPLGEDWVRVWSPAGTTAWVLSAETAALPAGSDGKALFAAALDEVLARRSAERPTGTPQPASAPRAEAGSETQAELDAFALFQVAEEQLDALPESASVAQLGEVRASYQAVLAASPDAPTRNLTESRLELVGLREELARMREDIAEDRVRSQQRREELERQIADANQKKDPLRGRFVARGWVTKEKGPDGQPVYLVRWAGDTRGQIVCSSGRYDLSHYVSFEVGVEGFSVPLDNGVAATRIDVRKLEVISGRPPKAR